MPIQPPEILMMFILLAGMLAGMIFTKED